MYKQLLLTCAGLLAAAVAVQAHAPAANANFVSERGQPFGLVLDGRPLTRGLAREVHVDRLVPGQHWAEFSLPAPYGRAVRFQAPVWLEPGLETTFVLQARPGRPLRLRQAEAVALYGPAGCGPRPGYGGPYGSGPRHGHHDDNDDYDDHGYGSTPGPGNYGNGSPGGYDGPGAGYYPGSASSSLRPLAPPAVDELVEAVQRRPFEATKLSTAKEALAQNAIRADDLRRLLRCLDFEASRVELAKFAYPRVSDPQNFFRVYDAFDFDSSVQDVQRSVAAR